MAKTILVVEDDQDLCSLLEYNLSRAGYEVRIANQVAGTLEMAESIGPDLVLLDVMLPDGDGFDICRLLRASTALAEVPFSREKLLETIWGHERNVTPRNVDVHVRRLRERIEESPNDPKWLQTVRGFGYRFEMPA